VEAAPLLAWKALPATQARTTLPAGAANADGVWATAAVDGDRATVLVSQWHPELTAAKDLDLSLQVDGLADGTYDVTIERIGESAQQTSASEAATATVAGGTVTLDHAVHLEGQSFARIDLRRSGVDALPALSTATGPERANRCLAAPVPPTTTTSTASSTTSTAVASTSPSTSRPTPSGPVPPAATPQSSRSSYVG
jgi:hypothetical protein